MSRRSPFASYQYGIPPFGEPAVDRRQQLAGFGALTLALPQAAEAHRGPQLQRFRLLAAGDVQGLAKTGFRLSLVCVSLLQQYLPLEPIQLRLPPTLPMFC